MSKGILEFDLPEEEEEFSNAVNGAKYKDMIEDTWDECFRPMFKHGYDTNIESLIEKCGTYTDEEGDLSYHGHDLIEAISEIFKRVTLGE